MTWRQPPAPMTAREDYASPVSKPGVGPCMTRKHCVRFVPVGAWNHG